MLLLFFILLVGAQKFLSHPAKDSPHVALLKEKKKGQKKMIHSFITLQIAQYLGKNVLNQAKIVVKVIRILLFILGVKERDWLPYVRKKIRPLVCNCFTITTHVSAASLWSDFRPK